jgi:hypothetical protein
MDAKGVEPFSGNGVIGESHNSLSQEYAFHTIGWVSYRKGILFPYRMTVSALVFPAPRRNRVYRSRLLIRRLRQRWVIFVDFK